MFVLIRRISRILALCVIYIFCGYMYLTAKGFVFNGKTFVLSNRAQAKEEVFSQKVEGEVNLDERRLRVKGNIDAPLTMYSYSSMLCAHCNDFHSYILPKLERDFISQGKLRYVFVHFPLDAASMRAAKLSYCMPAEKYYDFISKLYKERDWKFSQKEEDLNKYAEEFGMTAEDIAACKDDKKLTSDILLTRNAASKDFEIKGTPSFIVEGTDGKEVIIGARGYDELKEYLEKRLGGESND